MTDPNRPPGETVDGDIDVDALGHPRGTLAIVIIYAVLFGFGWLALYLFKFLGAGAPHGAH